MTNYNNEGVFMIHPFIELIAKKGIEVTISYDDSQGVLFDLNTQMKSGAKLSISGDSVKVFMRYGNIDGFDLNSGDLEGSFVDLCWIVKSCMHGRDFMSCAWEKCLVDAGVLKKNVKTTIEVSYE